jgi:hypothetical protein
MRTWVLMLAVSGCATSATPPAQMGSAVTEVASTKLTQQNLQKHTASWPEASKQAMRLMVDKYGQPDETTATQLVWHEAKPWKRVIVHAHEVQHNFPRPHFDVLEQVISYRVPVNKFDDLAAFDGSLSTDRTAGELTSRCDREEINMLAVNVANEIATGQRTVEDGRRFTAQTAAAFMAGESTDYTQKLLFAPPAPERARDRDRPLITDVVRGMIKGPPDR